MYKLKKEPSLLFSIHWAMDGNDSLKRIIWRSPAADGDSIAPGLSCKGIDTRNMGGEMYISREDVNKWAQKIVAQAKVTAEGVSAIFAFHFYMPH
jgi:hypothetical protein